MFTNFQLRILKNVGSSRETENCFILFRRKSRYLSLLGFCLRGDLLYRQLLVRTALKIHINFVLKHIWCCIHECYLHINNDFGTNPPAGLCAKSGHKLT